MTKSSKALAAVPHPQPATFRKATGSVEIAEPAGRLTLGDRQLFNHLLAVAAPSITDQEWHRVEMVALRRYAAEARNQAGENDNRRLKESVKRLQTTTVEYNYLDSERGPIWESSPLLGTCRVQERTGLLEFSFPAGLRERLAEPALYSLISLRVTYQFDSKYGLVLYEILKRYADRAAESPWWAVQTSELRDLLGCRDRLADYKDFRKRALDPALDEINRLAEFSVDLTETRQGRGRGGGQVVGLTFRIRRKDRAEVVETIKELDKPKIQRRGEKKTKALDVTAVRALTWLQGADYTTRQRWAGRAEVLGVKLPAAAAAADSLGLWVGSIATLLVEEEGLR